MTTSYIVSGPTTGSRSFQVSASAPSPCVTFSPRTRGGAAKTPGSAGAQSVNQREATGSLLKNDRSMAATFCRPVVAGCVPSVWKSAHAQVSPSERGTRPSAQI